MNHEEFIIIQNLQNDNWTEELMGPAYSQFRHRVLSKKERIVLEMRVQGMSIEEIANLLKAKQGGNQKVSTIKRVCYEIKRKFRTGQRQRIDNHPLLRAQKQRQGGK